MLGVKKSSANEDDVWLFLSNYKEVGFSMWQKAFVDSGLMAKQTWLNHKKSLEKEGKVKKKLSEITQMPVYYVPAEKKNELEKLAAKKEFSSTVENLEEYATKDELREVLTIFSSIPAPLIKSKFAFYNADNVSKIMMKVRARRIKLLTDFETPASFKVIIDKILNDDERLSYENLMFYYYPLDDSTMKMMIDLEFKQISANQTSLFSEIKAKDTEYADFLIQRYTELLETKPSFMV